MKRVSELKLMRKQLEKENARRPTVLTQIAPDQWPEHQDKKIIEVWISSRYLVQVFDEGNGVLRLSCNRTSIDQFGEWEQNLAWDELQEIKRQIGRADAYAVEVYPADRNIINVANLRHLWILPEPIVGWSRP